MTRAGPAALAADDSPTLAQGSRRHYRIDGFLVVALLVLAVQIRRAPLGPPSLWLDDAWPALVSRVSWSDVPLVGLTSPGFSAVVKAWTNFVGFSEYHAQQPAFVFGVLGPPTVYLIARRLGLRAPAALVAAAVLLVSRNHVIYSSRVKQYTLDCLLSALIILVAVLLLEHPERARRWALLVATAAVATVASSLVLPTVSGAFLAGAHAAWKRRDARRVAASAIGAYGVFAFAWWILVLRPRINPVLRSYWSAFYIRRDRHFLRDLGVDVWRLAHGLSWAPTLVSFAVLVAAAVVVVRMRSDLAILLLSPVVVAAGLATLRIAPLGVGRTDLNLYPALALIVGIAVAELRVKALSTSALVVVMLVAIAATYRPAPSYPAEHMRSAVAYLEGNARPSDEVLLYWAGRFSFALYAHKSGFTVKRSEKTAEGFEVHIDRPNLVVLPDHERDKDQYAAALARLTQNQDRVWFIGSHGRFDVVTIEKDLKALGYNSTRRPGDTNRAFVTLWTKGP